LTNRLTQMTDGRCFIVPGALTNGPGQELILVKEGLDLRDAGRERVPRHIAHRRPYEHREIVPSYPLERTEGKSRKDEIMIIQDILGDGDGQQDIEGFDRRQVVPQPEKIMIGLVGLAPIDCRKEGVFRGLDSTLV